MNGEHSHSESEPVALPKGYTKSRRYASAKGSSRHESRGKVVTIGGLILLFSISFFPMLTIPFVLLGLVSWAKVDFNNDNNNGIIGLPVNYTIAAPTDSYYTEVSPAKFALVSSWASTVAGNISAPFLILFSFLIARSLAAKYGGHQELTERSQSRGLDAEHHIRDLLHARTFMKLWKLRPWNRERLRTDRAVIVAVVGLLMTLVYSALIVAGDNWLHFAVQPVTYRYYEDPFIPHQNNSAGRDDPNSPLFLYAASYGPKENCSSFLNSTSPPGTQPCSITASPYNLANASTTYLVLDGGISSTSDDSGDFSNTDFSQAILAQEEGTASPDEVITYFERRTGLNHSLLFYLNAAIQTGNVYDNNIANDGYDYIASAHSMSTTCTANNQACRLNASGFYDCASFFQGNLSQESYTGLFRIPGWNTTFYTINNGVPEEIPTNSSENPFHFNVTAQFNTLSDQVTSSAALPYPLMQTVDGSVAFALSCTGTVYNVNYSLIDGAISELNATVASGPFAAIVRAPLQVGYGRYNLYQSAILAALDTHAFLPQPLESTMARAFSQVAVALSSGAFGYVSNIAQRHRFDLSVTSVPKAPVWFLSVVCAWYALVSLVVFVMALVYRKDERTREIQRGLGLEDVHEMVKKAAQEDLVMVGDGVDALGDGDDSDDSEKKHGRKKKKGAK